MVFVIKIEIPISTRDEQYRFLRDENNKVIKFTSLKEVKTRVVSQVKKKGFYFPSEVYRVGKSLRDLTLVATFKCPVLATKPVWKEIRSCQQKS